MKRTNDFQSIRSEGALLPPDLLRRILDPREKLPGTFPEEGGSRGRYVAPLIML